MNSFGVRDFALGQIAIALCLSGVLLAQDEPPQDSPTDVKPPPIDLVYSSLDLKYSNEGASGAGLDLKTDIVDLVSKGIEVKESESEIKIDLPGDILFDFDKASIRPAAEPTLAAVAKLIQSRKNAKVLIEGHTDSKGSDSYNAKLSDRRAASVKDWLGKHGVNTRTIQSHGWGAKKPVAPNTHPDGSDDPEGRQKNRRVEITMKK
jgi:outer membrane protein OmpA-like peptidoglycan-associated protein